MSDPPLPPELSGEFVVPVGPVAARQVGQQRERGAARSKIFCTPKSAIGPKKDPSDLQLADEMVYEAIRRDIARISNADPKGCSIDSHDAVQGRKPLWPSEEYTTEIGKLLPPLRPGRGFATGGVVDPATRPAAPAGSTINIPRPPSIAQAEVHCIGIEQFGTLHGEVRMDVVYPCCGIKHTERFSFVPKSEPCRHQMAYAFEHVCPRCGRIYRTTVGLP